MADGKGVRLESAYIELTADTSSVVSDVRKSLDQAGAQAQVAGKKMGDSLSKGVKSGLDQVGAQTKQTFDGVSRDIKKSLDDAGSSIASGKLKQGLDTIGSAARGATDLISGMGTSAKGAVEHLGNVGTALGKFSSKDVVDGLSGVSDALAKIGRTDAATKLGEISQHAKNISDHTSNLGTNFRAATDSANKFAEGKGIEGFNNKLQQTGGLISNITGTFMELYQINQMLEGKFGWLRDINAAFRDNPMNRFFGNMLGVNNNSTPQISNPPNWTNPADGQVYSWTPGQGYQPAGGTGLPAILDTIRGSTGGGVAAAPSGLSTAGMGAGLAALNGAMAGGGGITSAGVYNGPDANGAFPQWINALGGKFGLTPSTYSGHQTTNRAEAGFAPNPQNFNRGVDWGGPGTPPEVLQRFADFAQQHPELFEQVIWNNPKTGQTVTIAGGRLVNPSYYAQDLGGHTDHVHTRFSQGFQIPSYEKGTGGPLPEDTLAQLHEGEIVIPKEQVEAAKNLSNTGTGPEQAGDALARTAGFIPAAAEGNVGGVAGTSSVAGLLNLGNQAVAGLIDTGASMAQMALNAGMAAASFGGSAAAGPAAGAAGGYGIQLAATEGKRLASYGFQVGAIVADSLIEQAFPFGAPRWLGYDYTSFMPQLNISEIATTTAEKTLQTSLAQAGTEGMNTADALSQMPGGPVNPMTLPGAQPASPPVQPWTPPPTQPPAGPPGTGPGSGAPVPSAPSPAASKPAGPPSLPTLPMDFVPAPGMGSAPQSPQNTLFPPIFGRDEGGWLPDGALAYNTSGRSELVLSGQQLDAMAAQPAAPNRGGGATYYIQAADMDDAMRRLKAKERLEAMRYTGRF